MASYKHDSFLKKSCRVAYDELHLPGSVAPYAGIYRCDGCGHEIVSPLGYSLPDLNHHRHNGEQGAIRWRLIVFADHAAEGQRTALRWPPGRKR